MNKKFIISFSLITVCLIILAFIISALVTSNLAKNGVINLKEGQPQTLNIDLIEHTEDKLIPASIPLTKGHTHKVELKYEITFSSNGKKEYMLRTRLNKVTVDGESKYAHLFQIDIPDGINIKSGDHITISVMLKEPTKEEYEFIKSKFAELEITFMIENIK